MKKSVGIPIAALALVAALAAAVGCGSKTPPPQFAWDKSASFANLKTFAWHDGPPFHYPDGGGMVDARFIDEHVRRSVERALAKKGYQKTDAATPDIWVTYHTGLAGIEDHDTWGRYSWWSPPIHVRSEYEKQGTLALDVRDPGKKLIWRGMLTRPAGRSPEQLSDAIDHAVDDLLAKFPPS
jgi:hypothetical protein